MVVRHLGSYVLKTPGLTYPSNIKSLILKERSENPSKKPVIVFDASSFFFFQAQEPSVWCNGRPKQVRRKIKRFVENITSLGAYLVVVLRGNQNDDVKDWAAKGARLGKFYRRQLLQLKRTGTMDPDEEHFIPYAVHYCMETTLATIKNDNYMVFCSVEPALVEVVMILRELKGFAVIGENSNYLIYEGIKTIISASTIDLETLDCLVQDRQALLRHLRLESFHLPLFATLSGNDVVNFISLRLFHRKISLSNPDQMIAVADVVRETSDNCYSEVRKMVRLIEAKDVDEELVTRSLDMYLKEVKLAAPRPVLSTGDVLHMARLRQRCCLLDRVVVRILEKKEFRLQVKIEDLVDPETPPAEEFLKELRIKFYGILLFESLDTSSVTEYAVEKSNVEGMSNRTLYTRKAVAPKFPPIRHPGLLTLWTTTSAAVDDMKWGLFGWSALSKLDPQSFRLVPPPLIFPVAALHYLRNEVPACLFKKAFEVEAFVVTAVVVWADIDEESPGAVVPDPRALDLSTKFLACCRLLRLLNEALGYLVPKESSCSSNYFDGVLFQHVYRKMKGGANSDEFLENKLALKAIFSTLLNKVTSV